MHYSNSRSNIFDHSWTMKGNHVLKVVAHASPPLSPTPGFRQYDFFVNGQSFFTFPKVFRLGLTAGDPRGASSPVSPARMAESSRRSARSGDIANIEAPGNMDEVGSLLFLWSLYFVFHGLIDSILVRLLIVIILSLYYFTTPITGRSVPAGGYSPVSRGRSQSCCGGKSCPRVIGRFARFR